MDIKRYFNNRIYGITCFEHSRGRSTEYVVSEMLKAGIRTIQYREKYRDMKVKRDECMMIRKLTRNYNALFIVNDDVELAVEVDADGVHIGQEDMPYVEVKKILKENQIVGISTHSARQAHEAVSFGADYIGVGPVFETQTKEGAKPVGVEFVKYAAENIWRIPFVAIGGIKEHNIKKVIKAGATCVSLVTAITEAEDISKTITDITRHLR